MSSLVEFFVGLGFWTWALLGLLLIVLETMIPGVHFLWFGVSAMVVAALGLGLETAGSAEWLSLPWQLVLFAVLSVATVFWVRSATRGQRSTSDLPDLNARGAQYLGRVVLVEDAIVGGRGRVRVGDTLWAAEGDDAAKGSAVRVTGTNGTVLIVEPA